MKRPDLLDRMHEVDLAGRSSWEPIRLANAFFGQVAGTFPDLCAVATEASDAVVATGGPCCVLLYLPGQGAPCPTAAWTG